MSPGFDEADGFSALYDATHLDLFAFLCDAPLQPRTRPIAWRRHI